MMTGINKKLFIAFATMLLLVQPVLGQTVFGSRDCGRWVKRIDSPQTKVATEGWLAGYMSGMNFLHVANGKKDALEKVNSLDQMILWMDNYCNNNPLSSASDGAFTLFLELIRR